METGTLTIFPATKNKEDSRPRQPAGRSRVHQGQAAADVLADGLRRNFQQLRRGRDGMGADVQFFSHASLHFALPKNAPSYRRVVFPCEIPVDARNDGGILVSAKAMKWNSRH